MWCSSSSRCSTRHPNDRRRSCLTGIGDPTGSASTSKGSIHTATWAYEDVDVFVVDITGDDAVVFEAWSDGALDTWGRLQPYADGLVGDVIAESDDPSADTGLPAGFDGNDFNFRIETVLEPGTYVLTVELLDEQPAGNTYTLTAMRDGGGQDVSPSPMFSRYLEGSSGNNKYVEVVNPSAQTVDLQGCSVDLYRNGDTTPDASLALSGALAPSETALLCHSSATLATGGPCDVTSGSLSFNGDDALVLSCSGAVADRIGQVGNDPGTAWSGAGVSTRDASLERVCGSVPDVLPGEAFDPSEQWVARGVDDASGLGTAWSCE